MEVELSCTAGGCNICFYDPETFNFARWLTLKGVRSFVTWLTPTGVNSAFDFNY